MCFIRLVTAELLLSMCIILFQNQVLQEMAAGYVASFLAVLYRDHSVSDQCTRNEK